MRPPHRIFSFVLAAAVLVGGVWFLATRGDEAKPVSGMLSDPEPHRPACDFWRPWQAVVAPGKPSAYLRTLQHRLAAPSARSGDYQALIGRAGRSPGVLGGASEKLCIAGRFRGDGVYMLEATGTATCATLPTSFLESNLALDVERLEDNTFVNHVQLAVGLQEMRPEAVWTFLRQQTELLQAGYRGWSAAFPNYFAVNRRGFGLLRPDQEKDKEADGDTALRYGWLTQGLRTDYTPWADYLMRLSDLVSVRTAFRGADGQLLFTTQLDTVNSGLSVEVPSTTPAAFAGADATPLVVAHDVGVRFRGLEILLRGLRFEGVLTREAERIVYAGTFRGVDEVKVGGAYRGVVGGAFGKVIHELVAEHLHGEINRLMTGNGGRGWQFRIAVETHDDANVLTYDTSFQSPVNMLNVVREDKDETGNPVLPNKHALAALNRWTSAAVAALIEDERAVGSTCR